MWCVLIMKIPKLIIARRFNFEDNTWTEMAALTTNSISGPGKRWKFSSSSSATSMYIFGGYRLWHGFAPQNSESNLWSDYSLYPKGGYLSDLWEFSFTQLIWTQKLPKPSCTTSLSSDTCTEAWPKPRAGHTSVIVKDGLYIHGGYQTFYPYPNTNGPGAGRGVFAGSSVGYVPFPTNPYYLDDLWLYNITTGVWTQIIPIDGIMPGPRTEHTMIAAEVVFVLFGGYMSNYYYQDTWHFNITAQQWLQQSAFVHALYPFNCTDDLIARAGPHSGVYLPYSLPDTINVNNTDPLLLAKYLHYGTTKFSVIADPERGLDTDSLGALYSQARRQAPGWDGCRDRSDNRTDLPWTLQWSQPSQRGAHMAVYHSGYQLMLLYGGYGVSREELYSRNRTTPAYTYGDWWSYSLANCIKNCSLHGICSYGQCICDEGYYGTDCSNSSCPGTVCDFYKATQVTTCTHCCFSGFEHTDNDTYISGIEKFPCTSDNTHYSNGICDGFGKCICRPPFIGEDCSIRNCGYNCSAHGYCSVEFPNSRCLCDPGWMGKYCDQQVCLNNCSYPNGICVNGSCYCSLLYEPYNKSLAYFPYFGEDCSFMLPFAQAKQLQVSITLVVILCLLQLIFMA
ncbi:hypothetical protein THRCLA_10598 [Thraustotheca clavata]|uniref:EGF-like domain-containing protein n=1 Tax=Thraustotheca clavata TaxID=74557 RepID=A0A1V9YJW2_9STRA|nr:hypothetical protein THRCLA_10598 [Thraustotheca clavata]